MSKEDFLEAALPPATRYSLRFIGNENGKEVAFSRLYDSIAALEAAITEKAYQKWNLYYATAGFGAGDNATGQNAVAKKELYIDIDCGKKPTKEEQEKVYETKVDGLQALKEFIATVGLPKPTLIDSGNGIHAHWILDDAIPVHEWLPVAEALKNKCVEHGFKVDGGCTADVVRVLRIPETINHKGGHTVKLLTPIKTFKFETLRGILGTAEKLVTRKPKPHQMDELTRSLMGNMTSKFEKIWLKSKDGVGCAQILNTIDNSETTPEPLWRAVLSIAEFCDDRDWAIHEVSKNHPNYSPEETENKANGTRGPYTCETFEGIAYAHLCQGCPNKGKIKSPIQIGAEFHKSEGPIEVKIEHPEVTETVDLNEYYPFPFSRGANGGVYINDVNAKDDEGKAKLIIPYDLYIHKRGYDNTMGEVAWVRYHLPQDGVREFQVPQSDMASKDKLQTVLASKGVTVFGTRSVGAIQILFQRQLEVLQTKTKAETVHMQFGWTPNRTFVLGDREYYQGGVRYAPPADQLKRYIEPLTPKGTLEMWKKIMDVYNDPEYYIHAFCVLVGFGSLTMEFATSSGALISLYSTDSSSGKTTAQEASNSVCGHPKELMMTAADTPLARVHRMGVMNSMVVNTDEVTNMEGHHISDSAYTTTQQRGKERMDNRANRERDNHTRWKQSNIWSSNSSLVERLKQLKKSPQGELARIIEFNVPNIISEHKKADKALLDQMVNHYGHAGPIFIRHIIDHPEDFEEKKALVTAFIEKQHNWKMRERFKIVTMAHTFASGLIAKELGLINYDIWNMAIFVINSIKEGVEAQESIRIEAAPTISEFVNKNISNILVVNSGGSSLPDFGYRPRELLLRYEPDTDTLYMTETVFDEWCAKRSINVADIKRSFETETGTPLTTRKVLLSEGTKANIGRVQSYVIPKASVLLQIDFENEQEKI